MRRILAVLTLAALASLLACSKSGGSESGGDGEQGSAAGETSAGGRAAAATSGEAAATELGHAVAESERKFVVEGASTRFEAEYSDRTTVVAGDAVAALKDVDDEAHRYTFDAELAKDRGLVLEKGRVLLIAGRALRTIDAVKEQGGKLVVSTRYASLNQAIENGEIAAEVTLPLTENHVTAMVMPDGREVPFERRDGWLYATAPVAGTPIPFAAGPQPKLDWSMQDGTLTYKAKLVPGQDQIELVVQITRDMKPTGKLVYKAKGTIMPIVARAHAEFEDGETKAFEYGQDDIGGTVELSMAAAGGGTVEISKDVPALKLKWIVMVGPVPLVITTKARLIGRIHLPAKGSSTASATFRFSGSGGMKMVDKSVDAKIGFKKENFEAKPFDSAGFIGENVDTQFGVAFPVVSAGFFDSFMVPHFFTGVTIGNKLLWGPVCKYGYMRLTAHYGYDFKVLGVSMASEKKLFYKKEKTADQDGCLEKHRK